MKTWKENLQHPLYGDFHIHTCYSDGTDTIDSYCRRAKINGLTQIAFTEHVRKKLTYNFNEYLSDIFAARKHYPELTILAGCETKIMDCSGNLDVQNSVLDSCDLVTAVFHSFFSSNKEDYLGALEAMLVNPVVDVWGHPTLFAKKNGFTLNRDEMMTIIETCVSSNIIIEINLKYNVPDLDFIKLAYTEGAKFVVGSDAHAVDELLNKERLVKLWETKLQMC